MNAEKLTWRELDILSLITQRLSNGEIATRLNISINTVKWYNQQIFSKLGVSNRREATAQAKTLNLLNGSKANPKQQLSTTPHYLPELMTSFFGRINELEELSQLVSDYRIVTITGTGGTGKTRLAIQLANKLKANFSEGIWFIQLADISEAEQVANAIMSTLKIRSGINSSPIDALVSFFENKNLLVILDNFEHVTSAAPTIKDLLSRAPNLRIVATSRTPLGIYGEQEFRLEPLPLPRVPGAQGHSELKENPAIQLFIDRAKSVTHTFDPAQSELDIIAHICTMLDGLPLAIELTAPMTRALSLQEIARMLEKNPNILISGHKDTPARHRSLQATIRWSYELLNEEQKTLFARLGVFSGGATLDAIEAFCVADLNSQSPLILVKSLLESNLLYSREGRDGEMRFNMLETISAFSREMLSENQALSKVKEAHAVYYAQLAEKSSEEIRGEKNKYWFLRLKEEDQNLLSALEWSFTEGDPEIGLRIVGAMQYHWYYNGLGQKHKSWIQEAIQIAKKYPPKLQAKVLLSTGTIAYSTGELQESKLHLSQAVELYQSIDDELMMTEAYLSLKLSSIEDDGNWQNLLKTATEATQIFKQHNKYGLLAHANNVLGEIARFNGNLSKAKEYYSESLRLAISTGEMLREAIQYVNLGYVASREKDYQRAVNLMIKAFELFLELESEYGLGVHLASIAGPLTEIGYPDLAAKLLGASEAYMRRLGVGHQPADQPEIEAHIELTLKSLGKDEFERQLSLGRKMNIRKAVTILRKISDRKNILA